MLPNQPSPDADDAFDAALDARLKELGWTLDSLPAGLVNNMRWAWDAALRAAPQSSKYDGDTEAMVDAWVGSARDLARTLGLKDDDSKGSTHDWRFIREWINARLASVVNDIRRSVACVSDEQLQDIYATVCATEGHMAGLRAIVQAVDDGMEAFARPETAQPPASEAAGKRVYFDRVVAELNLDVRDTFTLLLANACALVDQRDALKAELAALRADGGTTKKVPVEVEAELNKAISKFPTWPTDPFHALAVCLEELGELAKATLHKTYEPHIYEEGEIEKEAVQTAAMGARFVRSLMRYRYLKSEQHSQEAT